MAKAKEAPAGVEPGKEVANIEEQIRKQLAGLKNRVGAPPSNKISIKNKVFTLPDGQSDNALNVIILDWRYVNAHYPGAYDPKSPQDPDCFAVGAEKPESGLLIPHESVPEPQAKDCKSCPKNEWGSAATGRGKACKNQIRLLVVGASPTEDSVILTLYVSPSRLKKFFAYATDLANKHGLDMIQVVTEITCDPNEQYPSLQFKLVGKHADVATAWALKEQNQDVVERPIEFRNNKD